MNTSVASTCFELLSSQPVTSLNLTLEQYRHKKTGALHLHLACDHHENAFMVALPTTPQDSTGVAHILEHSVLAGSERFPIRDPFFSMLRRSLQTYMNALTSSDRTIYPFATQNEKDFNNLLDVYLDAVFFPKLDPLTFAQEGHRVEFAEEGNSESELVYKGVVYNEMKGMLSGIPVQLHKAMGRNLFTNNTYHHFSGGDPLEITQLSYEQLKAFYEQCYHPGNAIFLTFGNIPAAEHQSKFEEKVLQRFSAPAQSTSIPDQQRYSEPKIVEAHYPLAKGEALEDKTYIQLGWLLGRNDDVLSRLRTMLLARVLLNNSASPLRNALETSELGRAPSPVQGVDASRRELVFYCGLQGCQSEAAEAVECMVMALFTKLAEEGVEQSQVEASLHQLELEQREIKAGNFPYGIQLLFRAHLASYHGDDVLESLHMENALKTLREEVKSADFIPNLIRESFLDNPHRVRLTMRPDHHVADEQQALEKERLQAIKAAMSEAEKQQVIEQARILKALQSEVSNKDVLPQLALEDIPRQLTYPSVTRLQQGENSVERYAVTTGGLVYQQLVISLPPLSLEQYRLLPLLCRCLSGLGVGEKSYLQAQASRAEVSGGLQAYFAVDEHLQSGEVLCRLTLAAKALHANYAALCDLLEQSLLQLRFDEKARVRELVSQLMIGQQNAVISDGIKKVQLAATAGLKHANFIAQETGGLSALKVSKQYDQQAESAEGLDELINQLQQLYCLLLKAPRQLLLIGEAEHNQAHTEELSRHWQQLAPVVSEGRVEASFNAQPVKQAWLTNIQVNFCARAYPSVSMGHPDSGALTVLGKFLEFGYLHREIREKGGAYGGRARQDNDKQAFCFFSYRDPRLEGTLNDFDASIAWLLENEHSEESLLEAILASIAVIDKPETPSNEAWKDYHCRARGESQSIRENYRQQVLAVTVADLKRVAKSYLQAQQASTAVISSENNIEVLRELGMECLEL